MWGWVLTITECNLQFFKRLLMWFCISNTSWGSLGGLFGSFRTLFSSSGGLLRSSEGICVLRGGLVGSSTVLLCNPWADLHNLWNPACLPGTFFKILIWQAHFEQITRWKLVTKRNMGRPGLGGLLRSRRGGSLVGLLGSSVGLLQTFNEFFGYFKNFLGSSGVFRVFF